jgi:DNA-binding CsgD family transcriptional regulator
VRLRPFNQDIERIGHPTRFAVMHKGHNRQRHCILLNSFKLAPTGKSGACHGIRVATPAQTKVGIQLALGKTKPVIADALGIQLSSVADLTRKLYQTLDVHNSAELGTKIWLGQKQDVAERWPFRHAAN